MVTTFSPETLSSFLLCVCILFLFHFPCFCFLCPFCVFLFLRSFLQISQKKEERDQKNKRNFLPSLSVCLMFLRPVIRSRSGRRATPATLQMCLSTSLANDGKLEPLLVLPLGWNFSSCRTNILCPVSQVSSRASKA